MRYRKLDANGDYSFGRGQADFWIDQPEAVAQSVKTRLKLWQNEWFLDLSEGTPYATEVLGRYTGNTRDPALRARILTTAGVTALVSYSSAHSGETRDFSVNAAIATIYSKTPIQVPR